MDPTLSQVCRISKNLIIWGSVYFANFQKCVSFCWAQLGFSTWFFRLRPTDGHRVASKQHPQQLKAWFIYTKLWIYSESVNAFPSLHFFKLPTSRVQLENECGFHLLFIQYTHPVWALLHFLNHFCLNHASSNHMLVFIGELPLPRLLIHMIYRG